MEHSELRIGNFIYNYKKEVVQLDSIYLDSTISGFYPCVSYYGICSDLNNVFPIEIDENWIKKLEFTDKKLTRYGYTYSKNNVLIIYNQHEYYICKKDEPTLNIGYLIKYIHELQNLYDLLNNYSD